MHNMIVEPIASEIVIVRLIITVHEVNKGMQDLHYSNYTLTRLGFNNSINLI